MGTAANVRSEEVIDQARGVADEALFPVAEDVDRAQRSLTPGLRALAVAGLFGIASTVSHGGSDLDPQTARRVIATIGGGCGATFFVWAQHRAVVQAQTSDGQAATRRST